MERLEAVCVKLETLGSVQSGERVEFDSDGSVHIVRTWSRWTRRKLPLSTNQSRRTLISETEALFELADQVTSGVLGVPLVRDKNSASTGHSQEHCRDVDLDVGVDIQDGASARKQFFTACDERTTQVLRRLSAALDSACKALNTLSTSTYEDDTEIGAAMMKLINYATMQRERTERCLSTSLAAE